MDKATEQSILKELKRNRVLTLATVRADGFPQATVVTFAHDGLTLYVSADATSQKARNIRRNGKVSAAMGRDHRDWSKITGLSLGGTARVLRTAADIERARACLTKRFPQLKQFGEADGYKGWAFIEITPQVVSVLDYRKGFGSTQLVRVAAQRKH
jgi:general stress protein 26